MSLVSRAFHDLLAEITPLEGAFSPVLRLDKHPVGSLSLSDLSDDCVRRLMADAIIDEPGGDAKLAAAYLIGTVSWSVCEPLAGLAVRGHWLAAAKPDAISLSERFVRWEEDGKRGVSLAFDLNINSEGVTFIEMPTAPSFTATLEQLHKPLIQALRRLSGLSQAALWRLVSDSLAAAFLEQGRAVDATGLAIDHARMILRDQASKLFNKQADFEWVDLPEAPKIGDWMRVRGGCCRYYTSPAEDVGYCTTCVLRPADSRRRRYRDYLRRTMLL